MTIKFKPKCIWCSADWSDDNVYAYADVSSGCPTCGPEVDSIMIKIICHDCGKSMYEKEQNGNGWMY